MKEEGSGGLLLKGERAREGQTRGKTQQLQLPVVQRDDDCLLLRRDSGCLPLKEQRQSVALCGGNCLLLYVAATFATRLVMGGRRSTNTKRGRNRTLIDNNKTP